MARKPRELTEGGNYHIYSKACGNRLIFLDDKDRAIFVEYMLRFEEKFDININCFALPDNHYHLHLQDKFANLSAFMHSLNSAYATYFNRRYANLGSVFNGRFKSKPIKNDLYFDSLFTYLAKNITKHGLARNPLEYKWFFIQDEYVSKLDLAEILSALNEKPRVRPLEISSYTGKVCVNHQSIWHYSESSRNVPSNIIAKMQKMTDELNSATWHFMRYYLSPPPTLLA